VRLVLKVEGDSDVNQAVGIGAIATIGNLRRHCSFDAGERKAHERNQCQEESDKKKRAAHRNSLAETDLWQVIHHRGGHFLASGRTPSKGAMAMVADL
jgi:hypothetical protein